MIKEIILTIPAKKNIALIAHDSKKAVMIQWVKDNYNILCNHTLCGTGTTARMITIETNLTVKAYNSGPLGGDQQIGAKISEGSIDMVIFFCEPLEAQPHDPDVKALMRIAAVYDIPMATNKSTADFLLSSKFINETYDHKVINFSASLEDRIDGLNNK